MFAATILTVILVLGAKGFVATESPEGGRGERDM